MKNLLTVLTLLLAMGPAHALSANEADQKQTQDVDSFMACQYRAEVNGLTKRLLVSDEDLKKCPKTIRKENEFGIVELYRLVLSTASLLEE